MSTSAHRTFIAVSSVCLTLASSLHAEEPLRPAADTFIQLKTIGDAKKANGDNPFLLVKSDRPPGAHDRVAILRFDLPDAIEPTGAVLRLIPKADQKQLDTKTLELYAAVADAAETTFDEAKYVAGEENSAVDHSGNRLREPQIVDADPSTPTPEPVATATLTPESAAVDFSSDALDAFLKERAGESAAFIITAAKPEEKTATPAAFFHSRQSEAGAAVAPALYLEGNPGEVAQAGTPKFNGEGAIVGTSIGFEPADGVELSTNVVHGENTIRYHFYYEDGRRFNLPAMGDSDDPSLSDEQAREGTHSLKLHVPPSISGINRDRIEFRFKHGAGDEQPFRFGQDRWYGYSIYIHPDAQPPVPGHYLHVGQLWQPSTVGQLAHKHEWGIPMAMSFLPGRDAWVLSAVAKSDGRRTQLEIGELTAGQWHDLTFNVLLSHSKDDIDGHFRVWLDGENVINRQVDIGNFPRELDDGFVAEDAMDIRFGIYRKNQKLSQTFYLDEVWFDDNPRDSAMLQTPAPSATPLKATQTAPVEM